jgi:hypothetical protein
MRWILLVALFVPVQTFAFSPAAIEKAVRHFFPNEPVMVEIARCESGLRQYTASGSVLRGGWSNKMIGLFQLHETYHRSAALRMGYNIDTLLGNLAYARELYRSEGTTPWNSSKHCWHTHVETDAVSDTITKTLRFGMRHTEVRVLQELLRSAGYQVTNEGQETDYFGISTYKAVLAFQCDNDIACLSKPSLRAGVGVVGPATRAKLVEATS